jgi:predicted nucleic acid-binding protein
LWHLEIANGLVVAERRGILTASDAMLALLQLEQLCAQALEVEADIISTRQAFITARTYQLSAYDSVYLDLALRVRLPLATLDVPLRKAAAKAGVELLS